jgi:2-hydroxychromene-2-carboxylate isomerase
VTAPCFFFGVMSPYSWLAAERIGSLLPAADWKPVFAGGMFKASDRVSWGLTERRAAGMAECEARARRYGLGAIRWPEPWPTSDHIAARAVLYAGARGRLRPMALELMRMAFREGRDLEASDAVAAAGRRVGLDPEDLARAVVGPELRAELRRVTDEALACGVIGVPTVSVGARLFWGDDRLEDAARAA